MESKQEKYVDTTPAAPLDKKTLNRMAWRSLQLQAAFNYERMQSAGWLWAILPGLKKIHTNKEDLSLSMKHNMEFLNTHPFLVTFVMGIVLSLEQQKADIQTIRSVRISVASPLGGVGDSLFWFTFIPIVTGITAGLALEGNIIGPILYFILAFGLQMIIRHWLMHWSYRMGLSAVGSFTKNAKEFTHAASMMGIFVVGAMIANMGSSTKLGMVMPGEPPVSIQSRLDRILPGILPLSLTLLCYFLIQKKKWSSTKCILLFLALGILGCAFGIWKGDYQTPIPVFWHS